LTQKTYFYLKGYQAGIDTTTLVKSGELSGIPKYDYSANFPTVSGGTIPFHLFSTQPVIPASQNSIGSFIGYSEVAEVNLDGSYTIYKYTNYSDGTAYKDTWPDMFQNLSSPAQLFPFPNDDHSEWRGKLKLVQYFQNNNHEVAAKAYNNFQLIYNNAGGNTQVHSINGGEIMSSCDDYVVLGAANSYDLGSYVPTTETDYTFNADNTSVQKVTSTIYNSSYKKINSTSMTASDGTIVNTSYQYPFTQSDNVSAAMVAKNIVSPIISQETDKGGNIVSIAKNVYQQWASDSNPGVTMFMPASTQIQVGNNASETRKNYLAYDLFGNLTTEAKPGGENIAYQWGYNNQYPTVKIENAANTLNSLTTTTNSTGNSNLIFTPTSGQQSISFNVSGTTNTTLTLAFSGPPSPANALVELNCTVTDANGHGSGNQQLCLCTGTASCGGGVNSRSLGVLPAGTYTLTASYAFAPTLSSTVYVQAVYPTSTTTTNTTGIKEFYYNGFEDDGTGKAATVYQPAHTGRKYSTATTVSWTAPNTRAYVISYWYYLSGVWKYSGEINYTATSYTLNSGVAAGATVFDDVRIYPKDALMTTYTYDPLVGATSSTDPKNVTVYYEYDSMQRLMNVKDKDGNILKHMEYHYQGQ